MQSTSFKSGFVSLLGRPSAGKSSLVNALCRNKVSIVSPVPQTTRNTIRGIVTEPRGQIVFLDTPGLHQNERKVNLRMRAVALEATGEADAVLYVLDTSRPPGAEEEAVVSLVQAATVPVVVALTKADLPSSNRDGAIAFLREHRLDALPRAVTSRLGGDQEPEQLHMQTPGLPHTPEQPGDADGTGTALLLDCLFPLLPEGEPWYPPEYYTDQEPSFRIAEVVREQAILRTRQEVPHALYVEVADLKMTDEAIEARVFLCVERSSQQGILVGHRGETVTAIRREAQRHLRQIFERPVRMQLQVKVRPRWRRDDTTLKNLIR